MNKSIHPVCQDITGDLVHVFDHTYRIELSIWPVDFDFELNEGNKISNLVELDLETLTKGAGNIRDIDLDEAIDQDGTLKKMYDAWMWTVRDVIINSPKLRKALVVKPENNGTIEVDWKLVMDGLDEADIEAMGHNLGDTWFNWTGYSTDDRFRAVERFIGKHWEDADQYNSVEDSMAALRDKTREEFEERFCEVVYKKPLEEIIAEVKK